MRTGTTPARLYAGAIQASKWLFPLVRATGSLARQKPLGAVSAALILLLVLMGALGPFLAPYDPTELGVTKKYAEPAWGDNLLGADRLGRDVLSRIIYGARVSLIVGVASAAAGTLVGAVMGLLGGYMGGKMDALLQRIVDIVMAYPVLIPGSRVDGGPAPQLEHRYSGHRHSYDTLRGESGAGQRHGNQGDPIRRSCHGPRLQ